MLPPEKIIIWNVVICEVCICLSPLPTDVLKLCVADGGNSDVVDIFNAIAGTWSTAKLSLARRDLSATSLPSQGLALFAGGAGALVLK